MSQHLALYGFVRRKDGLRAHPRGIDRSRCFLFHSGGHAAAVVSFVDPHHFQSNLANLVLHEETVQKVFAKQVFLPVKFPKVLSAVSLKRSLADLDSEILKVLQKIIFKTEFHVKVYLMDTPSNDLSCLYYNAFSRHLMEHSRQFRYKHYFPILTKEAKEAEFLHYAEQVVNDMSQRLCSHSMYWRAKSFCSEKVLLDSVFWVRKHRAASFLEDAKSLKKFYPNLRLSVLGPNPPYNFVKIDLKEHV